MNKKHFVWLSNDTVESTDNEHRKAIAAGRNGKTCSLINRYIASDELGILHDVHTRHTALNIHRQTHAHTHTYTPVVQTTYKAKCEITTVTIMTPCYFMTFLLLLLCVFESI